MKNVQTMTGQGHFYFSYIYENCKMAFFFRKWPFAIYSNNEK